MRDFKRSDQLSYIESLFTFEEGDCLKNVRCQFPDKKKQIQISPVEGKILFMLIKMRSVKTIVEVGTLAGYSALWMRKAIPSQGIIYTIEKNREHAEIARKNLAEHKNIILLEGDGLSKLNELQQNDLGLFDMIFIDADKGGYCDYLTWAEKNIKKGGLIVADNTLLFNTVFLSKPPENISPKSWEVMKKFNERLADNQKYDSILLPTTEGLTVALKK